MHPLSLAVALILDGTFGDPHRLPHPVRWIGKLIVICDTHLFPNKRSVRTEFITGCMVCGIVIGSTAVTGWLLLYVLHAISPYAVFTGEVIIGFYCISARSLAVESGLVLQYLKAGAIHKARNALSMVVGRDTELLDEQDIVRATVETVAENITDGIVSPLFYLALGGPVAALAFKAVSTMDSMIGHKNDRYRHFGTCAAILDDLLNFIPARLTGFIFIPLAAAFLRLNTQHSFMITRRDRLKHESPNSAHGEAAVAGALGVQLGGPATYQGIISKKPLLGDPCRPMEPCDIQRTIHILYAVTIEAAIFAITSLSLLNYMSQTS